MSRPILISMNGIITITRNVKLHYSQNYFIAGTDLYFGDLPRVGISYGNMDYNSPPHMAVHGFYICRNNASTHYLYHNADDISQRISPIWDTWFKETISYNPQSGDLAYFINDLLQTTFNVGVMPATHSPSLVMGFNSWGWWTGYEHLFDNLVVSQDSEGLDVAGTVKATAFVGDGSGLTNLSLGGFAETDPQVGANTNNYLSKWNGSALVSGTVYDNGNIGIGTNAPGAKLEVVGTVKATAFVGNGSQLTGITTGDPSYASSASSPDGTVFVDNGGNVGIGTNAPTEKLDVAGNAAIHGTLRVRAGGGIPMGEFAVGVEP